MVILEPSFPPSTKTFLLCLIALFARSVVFVCVFVCSVCLLCLFVLLNKRLAFLCGGKGGAGVTSLHSN